MKKLLSILVGMISFTAFGSPSDSLRVTINGQNLSEDMSTLSSRNDEVLLLIYSYDDTIKLKQPLLLSYFVLDSANRKKMMTLAAPEPAGDLLLVLAELDTDRNPEQVERLIRKNFRAITACIEKRDLISLKNYIGDDDILGTKVIQEKDFARGILFAFQGRYKLDKYLYKIDIKKLVH
ncbi:MAG TPA: hypothetical protein VFW11_19770 [Cyclobacteriaceae bacterium]|nr:hypothetical protein [Cyclobacteriaceae bacterium]